MTGKTRKCFAVGLWGLVLLSCFYNLANFPTLWWDEAIFCETAANLAQHGRYALTLQSPDQLQDFDNRISAGPAIILPVALTFRLFGVEVEHARTVAALFLLLTLVFLYLASRLLVGRSAALLGVGLALACTDLLYWGRSVLGDIPALGCFLGGSYFFLKALQENRQAFYFPAGLCLGLAFGAKEFYAFTVLPPLAVLALSCRRDWRLLLRGSVLLLAGAAAPAVGFVLLKAWVLKSLWGAVQHFYYQKQLLCHEFFTPFTIGRVYPESWAYLLTHPLFLTGGLGFWQYLRRQALTPAMAYWLANFILWSGFYLLAVYWQRFALPALLLASPLAAYLVLTLAARLAPGSRPLWLRVAVPMVLVALLYPFPLTGNLATICTRSQDSPYRLEEYLRRHVPRTMLIETPEYELPFLDDEHRFHLLPEYYFLESDDNSIKLLNPNPRPYDFTQVKADMLILGSFGKSVFRQIYPPDKITRFYRKIATIDYYDIYLRKTEPLSP